MRMSEELYTLCQTGMNSFSRRLSTSADFLIKDYCEDEPLLNIHFNDVFIALYLINNHVSLPGFYLFKKEAQEIIKPMFLIKGCWYSLNIAKKEDKVSIYITPLSKSYLALNAYLVHPSFNQGLAFDGNYWYFTHTTAIFKAEKTYLELANNLNTQELNKLIIKTNRNPIPSYLQKEKYFHLGDPDYYEKLLVIPIERKGFVKPSIIAIYDTETLDIIRYSYTNQDHMPWLAVDSSGHIYSSEYINVNKIYVYNIEHVGEGNYISPVKTIKLSKTINKLQGGAFLDNTLIITTDDGGDNIYSVNIKTGKVDKIMELPSIYETEGIEIVEKGSNKLLYILVKTHKGSKIVYELQELSEDTSIHIKDLDFPYERITLRTNNKCIEVKT